MAKTITITYSAITAPPVNAVQQICDVYYPTNNASRNPVFDNTYYDTNVEGFGEVTTIEAFMADMVAHPGLVAALRAAMNAQDGTYTYADATELEALYAGELAPALKAQGFTIEVTDAESNASDNAEEPAGN